MSAITKPVTWECPVDGERREATTTPHHRHDDTWVPFQQVSVEVPPARRGRPRKSRVPAGTPDVVEP